MQEKVKEVLLHPRFGRGEKRLTHSNTLKKKKAASI
jgi:hypothetical protein